MKHFLWFAIFAFSMFSSVCLAGTELEYEVVRKLNLPTTPVDVTISPNEKWYYILTPGNILVFSAEEESVVKVIPVGKWAQKIEHAPKSNLLIIADAKDRQIQMVRIDFIREFSMKNSPFLGPEEAPVTVVIFNHYQCPYCARLDPKIVELMNLFGESIKIVYKSFPPYNQVARTASSAAIAAHQQEKFWEMHKAMHEIERPFEEEKIMAAAQKIGLDMEKFQAALENPQTMAVVDRDIQEGLAADVDAVPYFFINGKHMKNEALNSIYQIIEQEIKKSTNVPPPESKSSEAKIE